MIFSEVLDIVLMNECQPRKILQIIGKKLPDVGINSNFCRQLLISSLSHDLVNLCDQASAEVA